MPKNSKRKFNPAVRNVPSFKKKKIKVGRHLPHANSTNTEIKSKKIILTEQNVVNELNASIYNKNVEKTNDFQIKDIDVVISQLGHHNENMSRTAICETDTNTSFLQKSDSLLYCCKIICPLLLAILYEMECESDRLFNSIMSRVNLTLNKLFDIIVIFIENNQNKSQENNNIKCELRNTFASLKKCSFVNKSKKLMKRFDFL
uniref:Uncharacterized protein n=1 Tax=Meloidogyne hapla TaxID=6305 RepID=A0A1I8BCL2_MELHA